MKLNDKLKGSINTVNEEAKSKIKNTIDNVVNDEIDYFVKITIKSE